MTTIVVVSGAFCGGFITGLAGFGTGLTALAFICAPATILGAFWASAALRPASTLPHAYLTARTTTTVISSC